MSKEIMQQALEALEGFAYHGKAAGWPQTMTALRAALAQKDEPTHSQKMTAAGFTRRPSLWALQAREALELIAGPDGLWDREACRQIAAEALGRYEDD